MMRRMLMIGCVALGVAMASGAATKDRVVIVSAHPDDLGGQMGLALLLAERYELHVIDYTHGERGCGEEKFRSGWTKATRTAEEEKVCAGLGAKLWWLDEVDGEAMAGRGTCEKLAGILKELQPRAVILHWPMDTHNDHVMSYAGTMRALQIAKLSPEIYFHEQGRQSRGFAPCYFVPVKSVAARKAELIRNYACQNGEGIAQAKADQNRIRGYQCFDGEEPVEVYAVLPGTVKAGGGILDTVPGVSH